MIMTEEVPPATPPKLSAPFSGYFAQIRAGLAEFEKQQSENRSAASPIVAQDMTSGVLIGFGENTVEALERGMTILKAVAYAALTTNKKQQESGLSTLNTEAAGVLLALSNKNVLLAVVKNATDSMLSAMDAAAEKSDYRQLSHISGGIMAGIAWRTWFIKTPALTSTHPSLRLEHKLQTKNEHGETTHTINLRDVDKNENVGFIRYQVLEKDATGDATSVFVRRYEINDAYSRQRLSDELFRCVLQCNPKVVSFSGEMGALNLLIYKSSGLEMTPWAKSMDRLGFKTQEQPPYYHDMTIYVNSIREP